MLAKATWNHMTPLSMLAKSAGLAIFKGFLCIFLSLLERLQAYVMKRP
jgi:hypothetical protein